MRYPSNVRSQGTPTRSRFIARFDGRWRCAESAPPERCTLFGMTAKTPVRPGRNEPCHCGSGRKYKVCCLEKDNAALTAANARAAADAAERPAEAVRQPAKPTTKHQTEQPWKASTSRGFVPRPRGPRKVGGG